MKTVLADNGGCHGTYVIKKYCSITGKLLETLGPVKNKIVNSDGRGYDIIALQLIGDTSYDIEIDSAKIGTGSTAPTAADTDLETIAVSDIEVADTEHLTSGQVLISFFITDGQLANGTYREFGIFAGTRLFARSLISPVLTKGSNQNITIEYTLTFS